MPLFASMLFLAFTPPLRPSSRPAGYIRLELPVFHIGYFKNTVQILQAICKGCSHVLLNEEERRSFLRCAFVCCGCSACMGGWVGGCERGGPRGEGIVRAKGGGAGAGGGFLLPHMEI